jgi:hypothetical protein
MVSPANTTYSGTGGGGTWRVCAVTGMAMNEIMQAINVAKWFVTDLFINFYWVSGYNAKIERFWK